MLGSGVYPANLNAYAATHGGATPRANIGVHPPRSVLAYIPGAKEMALAMTLAHTGAIAAIEWPSTPLHGWAMERRAVNLCTGEVTADTRTSRQREWLAALRLAGSNLWTDEHGKRVALHLLAEMNAASELDRDVTLGYMMAFGSPGRAIQELESLISKVHPDNRRLRCRPNTRVADRSSDVS
jgi:hypothetical protein